MPVWETQAGGPYLGVEAVPTRTRLAPENDAARPQAATLAQQQQKQLQQLQLQQLQPQRRRVDARSALNTGWGEGRVEGRLGMAARCKCSAVRVPSSTVSLLSVGPARRGGDCSDGGCK